MNVGDQTTSNDVLSEINLSVPTTKEYYPAFSLRYLNKPKKPKKPRKLWSPSKPARKT